MRSSIVLGCWFLVLGSLCAGAERFVVTAPPHFCCPPAATKNEEPRTKNVPLCVKVSGIDTDVETLEKECYRAWSWPGGTQASLEQHLREHGVSEFEGLPLESLKKIHAAIHERELRSRPPIRADPQSTTKNHEPRTPNPCPGGVCPSPGAYRPTRWRLFR